MGGVSTLSVNPLTILHHCTAWPDRTPAYHMINWVAWGPVGIALYHVGLRVRPHPVT